MMIDFLEVRGKIIRTVLCLIVYMTVVHNDTHTRACISSSCSCLLTTFVSS